MNRSRWTPLLILVGGIIVAVLSQSDMSIRAPLVLGYSLVAPGLVFARFLRIQDRFVEFTLAIALSIALNVIVSEFMIFARAWSPTTGLFILIYLSMAAALYELVHHSRLLSNSLGDKASR